MSIDFVAIQANAWCEILEQMTADPLFMVINKGSANGPGSSLECTAKIREQLPQLLRSYRISTMIDAPCGDWNWMSRVDLGCLHSYIGFDVAEPLIRTNQIKFSGRPNVSFVHANLLTRKVFPKVDLIMCRDFLAHLTTEYISVMLDKFTASGSTYLLASNYPGEGNDFDYVPGDYPWLGYLERGHDLTAEPFNLTRVDGIPEVPSPGGILTHDHELGLFKL